MIQGLWDKCNKLPGGRFIFSKLIARNVPYSGSIGARVVELRPGYAKLSLSDRKKVRNHLNSIHAIALCNLAELASGLAFNIGLPKNARAIVTKLSIEYLKKARGTLICECSCPIIESNEKAEFDVESIIKNAEGDIVARFTAHWRVGPNS